MSDYPITGQCQCGNVKIKLLAPPIKVIACHCLECQTLSTSAFSITTIVKQEDISIEGELKQWERSSDSGNRNVASFCPTCGNRIFHINPDESDIIKLKARLNNAQSIAPVAHIWLEAKHDWFDVPSDAAQCIKQV